MTSRNHVIVVAVLLVFAIVAAAAYALGDRTGSTRNPATGSTPGGTATGPAPTAPVSGPTPRTSPGRTATAGRPTATAATPTKGGTAPVWLPSDPAIADVCRTRLPAQADDTLVLIAEGGPYPYRSDGVVFENREGLLPRHTTGYYHEYTVVTPDSGDRGTRRIVTGTAGEQYWTSDHYASFREIDPRC
ncbi:ribonuclease domain-containing protein [Streptomyces sp. NRRL B-24484]|uniref:ribonuclease domain-containing protein n=1 Tax=Streptomyces sp. NRRL B-24484 TaxID=1463833 RepID=UPI000998194D